MREILSQSALDLRKKTSDRFSFKQDLQNIKNNVLYGHKNNSLNCGLMLGNMNTGAYRGGGIVGGWKELARLSVSTSANLDLTSIPNARELMILYSRTALSASTFEELKINGSTTNVYASRASEDGAADFTRTSQGDQNFIESSGASMLPAFAVYYGQNYSAKEKVFLGDYVWQVAAGATTAPSRGQNYFKWVNTADVIDRLNLTPQSGTLTGELVVLGKSPNDVHTTNFWTEIASGVGDGTSSFDTGVFSSTKKYIWIQAFIDRSAGSNATIFRVGNTTLDTGNNYADRYSVLGGADSTTISTSSFNSHTSVGGGEFYNIFAINNPSNEKLFICHTVHRNTAGAANAPRRAEFFAKWVNTSNQFDIFGVNSGGADTLSSASYLKIWGSD